MTKIQEICTFLEQFAPTSLAEDWDNVGLLAGDRATDVNRIMTCLTITPESAQEAIDSNCDLIVSHHPLPFRPIRRITTDNIASQLLWQLIRAGVAIYSPHTGFDSAADGINFSLLTRLNMSQIEPLIPNEDSPESLGSGRMGHTPTKTTLVEFIDTVKSTFDIPGLHVVGQLESSVSKVAVACGSGGSFLKKAIRKGCDTFVTGETNFHTCLEAEAHGVNLVLLGHYSSERFAIEMLADKLSVQFPETSVHASKQESDPLIWM